MCPVCRGVTEARNPAGLQAKTDAFAHALIMEGSPRVELFHGDESDLLETIAMVAKDLPYHCTCESI